MRESIRVWSRGLIIALLAAGCGDEAEPTTPVRADVAAATSCTAQQLEEDATTSPLMGRAADPSSGQLQLAGDKRYMVSTTYLALKPGSQGRFEQLMAPIAEQLPSQPGLLAVQFKTSTRCGTARTFAVWESEEAMFAFVTSPHHLEAMRSQSEVARDTSDTVSLEAAAGEVSWERAVRELGGVR